ncbi:MAG: molybdopterin-synthase adenylyltransferase MoeB [Wenzhouxiangellaceae bacterium]|nr:molybdopterin-synthase adenylyltransferase MoeB [Wenzhouxiangellaceae bacterium]
MPTLDDRLAALRAEITQLSPAEARERQDGGAVLIDVREADEHASGIAEGARALPRGKLEMNIDSLAEADRPVLLMCAAGPRSLLAADDLRRLGYRDVAVVDGGFGRWKDEGLPWQRPEMPDADAAERYARQVILPELGNEGQAKLADARVLLIGAGGLGSPAALYLAAAGVGTLGLVDNDTVDRSNLHRQVLHRDDRVGWPKTDSARATLEALNPRIRVRTHRQRLTAETVEQVFEGYRIVADGSDNFPTRYLVNDACIRLGVPNVYGAVERFEGQVAVFGAGGRPCYRCLFAEPPAPEAAPSCAEAGVLGVVPGVIGMLQALEVIKLITGIGETLTGRLLLFDARAARFRELRLSADPDCRYCRPGTEFPGYIDYAGFCSGEAHAG